MTASFPNGTAGKALAGAVRDLGLSDVSRVGGGLEFQVWRAAHPRWGWIVLRVPERRFESNANDPHVDTAELLFHEAMLCESLRRSGIPVPRHYEILHYEVDISVAEFVASDDSSYDSFELGQITAILHGTEVPKAVVDARPGATFAATIAERLSRRWTTLCELDPELPALSPEREIAALLTREEAVSLLHLDLRAANLIVRENRIRALIDWSNWLIGDPALELARVAAYARLPENRIAYSDFLRGYESVRPVPTRTVQCWNFYHLDAVAMLAVVFNCEVPDQRRGPSLLRNLFELWRNPWDPTVRTAP